MKPIWIFLVLLGVCPIPPGIAATGPCVTGECHPALAVIARPHQPVGAGDCLACHDQRQEGHPTAEGGEFALAATGAELCYQCHNLANEIGQKKNVHGPVREGQCVSCHDPHGSDSIRLLKGPYPTGFYAQYQEGAYDFCLKCHQKYLLRFADTTIYTDFRDGRRNLHHLHVVKVRKGRTCLVCHEPHAGDGEKLTRSEGVPFGAYTLPIRFEPTANGGSCAPGCHRPRTYDREKSDPVSGAAGDL